MNQPPPDAPQPPPPPPMASPQDGESVGGLFSALFDLEFKQFITLRFIKVIYVIIMVLIALGALVFLIAALGSGEGGAIVFALIVVPLMAFLYLILARVYLEVIAVLFRIGENTTEIARRSRPSPG